MKKRQPGTLNPVQQVHRVRVLPSAFQKPSLSRRSCFADPSFNGQDAEQRPKLSPTDFGAHIYLLFNVTSTLALPRTLSLCGRAGPQSLTLSKYQMDNE